jgi:hypothetical protein
MPRGIVLRLVRSGILVVLAATEMGCLSPRPTLEQIAMDTFAREYWNPQLFVGECTGLRFDENVPLAVVADSRAYQIVLLDVWRIAGVDERTAASSRDGNEEPGFPRVVDLRAYPFSRPASSPMPNEQWSASDGYLLRFSNRLRFEDHLYLQAWVKSDRWSSGVRVDFKFDLEGKLIASEKHSIRCDDWG